MLEHLNESLSDFLSKNFSPEKEIDSEEKLFGRTEILEKISRALETDGRHVFIHGDRGVGKSSIALTSAYLHNSSRHDPIILRCSNESTFKGIFSTILNKLQNPETRFLGIESTKSLMFGSKVTGISKKETTKPFEFEFSDPLNDALDIVNLIASRRDGNTVIIIDEFDRIQNQHDKNLFSEFAKSVSSCDRRCKFIFCGIGSDLDQLIELHPSAGRTLTTIQTPKLPYNQLIRILTNPAYELNITVPEQMLIRVYKLSDQYPHYLHLFGEGLLWAMQNDPEIFSTPNRNHYNSAIKHVIDEAEAYLKNAYRKATLKSKNTIDFEIALWSLAEQFGDKSQIGPIYNNSYKDLVVKYNRVVHTDKSAKELTKRNFSNRLHSLRQPNHGSVVTNYGSGWFAFTEKVFRGYCRFEAENRGIELKTEAIR